MYRTLYIYKVPKHVLIAVHLSLQWSIKVASITEVFFLMFVPNCLVQEKILRPFKYQTGGTVLAARLALDRRWAINIGGGFHHCSGSSGGGGFCVYADITLAIRYLFENFPERIKKVMIIDLDAHQVSCDFSL